MYAISTGNEPYAEPMPTDMLKDIRDGCQSHPIINMREARYKIRDHINQG